MSDLSGLTWRKASHSSDQGNCVEVAGGLAGVVGVRDSKDVAGPALIFGAYQWRAFVQTLKSNRPA
ncbi:DUF397 domain-containing protein [Micromonospora sp. Llam7]|uniref:DUF397 domain-containing protein n=1 Tax=Micromonospora tarapacensis TaxID=2835305 RepID=UPI001C835E16|nr:DUF397 domain-containing protein [Micromonospora tarapacensis]MBX7268289.1 DUF397 domain-containing protein [Micromonospora tarapacensis]